MCIVIDADTLSRVFNARNSEHCLFRPVFEFIVDGPGMIVYGGTRYEEQAGAYVSVFAELKRQRKVHVACKTTVDEREQEIRQTLPDPDFDDQHIVAILLVTRCMLVCSADKRSHKFLTHRAFFPKAKNRPKLYGGLRDAENLCIRNIPKHFKPCHILGKAGKKQLAAKGLT